MTVISSRHLVATSYDLRPAVPPTGKWGKARRLLPSHHSFFTFDPEGQGAGCLDVDTLVESYLLVINFIVF